LRLFSDVLDVCDWGTVAILEWKKWGTLRGQGKSGGQHNVYLAWRFFIVLKIKLLWLTLSNPTYACEYHYKDELAFLFTRDT